MKTALRAFASIVCCLVAFLLPAQNPNLLISYKECDSLFVCGVDTFSINIENNGGALPAGATLTIALPAGLLYLPGSITGATQLNISDLQHPAFTLGSIASIDVVEIKILLTATCAAADSIDAGAFFPATISVQAPNVNTSITSNSIRVETGLLLIESIDSVLMSGEKGDTLYRKICIKNTRPGKISNLHFEDQHEPGFEIFIAEAATQNSIAGYYIADFDPTFFSSTGNGDLYLDQEESLCFTERIIITDCGIPQKLNTSLIKVGWGCGADMCRFYQATPKILIKPSTRVPDLQITQIWHPPVDNCAQTPALLGLKIKNLGRGDATNVSISFNIAFAPDKMGIDPASFRIVGSNGSVLTIVPNLYHPNPLSACGVNAADSVSITIPFVAAKDSLELRFDLLNCVESCRQHLPSINVEYFYRKDCPVNGFVSESTVIIPDERYNILSKIQLNIGACLQDGQSYPALFEVISKRMIEAGGFLNVEFELPHGISIDNSCGTLLGSTAPVVTNTSPGVDGSTLVHLSFALPLPQDSLRMNFCLHYTCDTNLVCIDPQGMQNNSEIIYGADCAPCFTVLKERAYWTPALNTPYKCAIGDCDEIFLALEGVTCDDGQYSGGGGDTSGTAPAFPFGYHWKMDVARINFGFRDSLNNRTVYDGTPARPSEIRLDRYLPGDTSRVTYCGVMEDNVLDTFLTLFPRVIWHEVLQSDVGGVWDNDQFSAESVRLNFTNALNLRFMRDSIRIHYANGTQVAFALNDLEGFEDQHSVAVYAVNTAPPAVEDVVVSQRHAFKVSLPELFAQGLLPKPTFNEGDSIFFYTDFKMDMNYNPLQIQKNDPQLIGFRTALAHYGGKYAWNKYPFKRMQYSGIMKSSSRNTFNIKPCENSIEVKKFRYALRIARENLFPFEIRPLGWIQSYGQTVPNGLTVLSAKLQYLALQDSVPWMSNINLPFSQAPGRLELDYSPVFSQALDEGFELASNITFGPDCYFEKPDSSKQWVSTQYNECLHGTFPLVTDTLRNVLGFFTSHPELVILSADSLIFSPTRPFEFSFSLKNPFSTAAAHPWVSVQSSSGLVTDFELIKLPQNQSINAQNGIFNLPGINGGNEIFYKLKGSNISCETDTLRIIFGWGCTVLNDINASACYRDTYIVLLNLARPELDLNIAPEPLPITLCDTSDYFEFEIFNGKYGYAYDLFGSVKLPEGLEFVPNSSQMYHSSTGVWQNVSDPDSLSGHLFRWNISELQAYIKANGLPGDSLSPLNLVKIRFRTLAKCGFVANIPVIYGAYGKEPCGRSSNVLNKTGDPVSIDGLSSTYEVQPNIIPLGNQPAVCGGEQEFNVQIILLGTASPGDSAVIILPQGVSLIAASYIPGLNAPASPPTLLPNGFRVALPLLPGNGDMQFKFKVLLGPGSGCADQIISIQTRVHAQAFCVSAGTFCDVYVSTGNKNFPLQVEHPELTIGNAAASIVGGQASISLTINNIGSYLASGVTAQVWQDLDGNQMVSAGDILLQTLLSSDIINPGTGRVLTGELGNTPMDWCALMIVLPAAENCGCTDVIYPLSNLTIEHKSLVFCNTDPVQLGVDSLDGFHYQWQSNPGLACLNCATALFTPDPGLPAGQVQTLILEESSASCTLIHRFELAFGATASIALSNASICSGTEITLTANPPNATYAWQGTGIQMPGNQVQILHPTVSTLYTVLVTLANGCTASASASVAVLPLDTLILSPITACQDSIIKLFGNDVVATAGIYPLSYQNVNGCDSTILQPVIVLPKPLTMDSVLFCAGDTVFVFGTIPVSVSTEICRHYEAFNSCDSMHCIRTIELARPLLPEQDTIYTQFGQPLEIGGLLGYHDYTWSPMPDPPCFDCPSIMVPTDSAGTFEYILAVKNDNNCDGSVIWRVVVFPPCDPKNVKIPNAFTPNNDNFNDFFRPVIPEGGAIVGKLSIFDRWGEKVYEGFGDVSWDGTIRGKPASSDVYVYIIELECDGVPVSQHGEISLIR